MSEISSPHHDCIWEVLGVEPPAVPYSPPHPRVKAEPVFTIVLVKCKYCNVLTTLNLEGFWTEDQIKGDINATDKTAD